MAALESAGYLLARRGMQPEIEYGKAEVGSRFDPRQHHRLLIPTTGDAYPNWTLEYFQRVVAPALEGEIVVLQFHGVPDLALPWVHTPPEQFRAYMAYLKELGVPVLALRDLEKLLPDEPPLDRLLSYRHSAPRRN